MTPLLTTKFFIPSVRPEHISRPRLVEQLTKGLDRKMSLISAPAGFGKSMLVSEWISALASTKTEPKIAWISLDESDNDPARFLSYFVAAISRAAGIDSLIGESLLGMLASPQVPPPTEILTALINAIAEQSGKLVAVLDDFHAIEAEPVIRAMTFLIENSPPQLHLVIATRDDPPLPLASLRAQGQMTELRAIDLRFSKPEIAEFIKKVEGLQLSQDEIELLETRSEGWVVGLQLAAIALHGYRDKDRPVEAFSGSHRFVLDYLIEEVLDQQPERVKIFLLRTSILNRFTGSLCDAVTGQGDGQSTLEDLERANLFIIPLDDERRWYRYHHLFADTLRLRLHQTQSEDEHALHLAASKWFEQNGFADETIEHALLASDCERASRLIEVHIQEILNRGEYAKVYRWLDEIPEKFVITAPDLCITKAWHYMSSGQLEQAEFWLQAVENHSSQSSDAKMFRGRVAAVRAFLNTFRGDIAGIIQQAHLALDLLPAKDLIWRSSVTVVLGDAYGMTGDMSAAYKARVEALEISKAGGDIYLILISAMKLAVTYRMLGQLPRVIDVCQEHMALATERGVTQMMVIGWLQAVWAEVLAETNHLDEALEKGRAAVELTAQGDDIAMIGWSQMCLVRILFSRGDLEGAKVFARKLDLLSVDHQIPPYILSVITRWRARIMLAQNKQDEALQWMQARNISVDGEITQLNESEYIVFARLLLAQEKFFEAITLLKRLSEAAKSVGRVSRLVEINILLSLAYQAKEDQETAIAKLEQALELAEPGGFVRVFVDEGPPLARLLYDVARRKASSSYVQKLLAAFPAVSAESSDGLPESPKSGMVEHLSERELEVLKLLAEGKSRQDLAAELVVSLNTVKVHIRNIYSKLDVHSQIQAVSKARGLGIIA